VRALSALAEVIGLESWFREDEGLKKRLKRRGVTVGGLFGLLLRDDGGGGDEGRAGEEGYS